MTAIAATSILTPITARADDSSGQGFFASWFDMATRSQNEQPHWMTPLVTVTPRLEQEFRYDQYLERLPSGAKLDNYGAGKGLEIIPTENTELIFGAPAFEQRSAVYKNKGADGWGDWPFLLAKYRLLSGNEQNGNYIVSAFLQFSAPTGAQSFTNNFYIVQPTIAAGKGWGDFDIQATLSEQFPFGGQTDELVTNNGKPILANIALQYHLVEILWPEIEANYTYWPDGVRQGKSQLYVTPGIIFGRFPIYDRVKLIFGVGYQTALTPHKPGYNNNAVFTVRSTF